MAKLVPENITRKIDHLGRITLPKALRDRMYLNSQNDELEIFTMEMNGKLYICLGSPESAEENKLYAAMEVFKEMGVKIPDELQEKYNELIEKRQALRGIKVIR